MFKAYFLNYQKNVYNTYNNSKDEVGYLYFIPVNRFNHRHTCLLIRSASIIFSLFSYYFPTGLKSRQAFNCQWFEYRNSFNKRSKTMYTKLGAPFWAESQFSLGFLFVISKKQLILSCLTFFNFYLFLAIKTQMAFVQQQPLNKDYHLVKRFMLPPSELLSLLSLHQFIAQTF